MSNYSISFYLRRKKHIYCRLTINTFSKDSSTGISIYPEAEWIGGRAFDPKNRKLSESINDQIESYKKRLDDVVQFLNPQSPDKAFDLLKNQKSGEFQDKHPKTIVEAIRYYIAMTKKLKGLKNKTLYIYDWCVKTLILFLIEEYNLEDIPLKGVNTSLAKNYRIFLNEKGLSSGSIKNQASLIRASINMVLEDFPPDEYPSIGITYNPFNNRKLFSGSPNSKIKEYIPYNYMGALWNYFKDQKKHSEQWNNALISLLMWNSGYSFSDLCNEPDITTDLTGNKFLTYTRKKSGVEGRVLYYEDLEKVLTIIKKNKKHFASEYNNWIPVNVFVVNGDIDMSLYNKEYKNFRRFCDSKLIKELLNRDVVSPHLFRHSFAVHMLEQGHSMESISVMLAHSSPQTAISHYGYISNNKLALEKKDNTRRLG